MYFEQTSATSHCFVGADGFRVGGLRPPIGGQFDTRKAEIRRLTILRTSNPLAILIQ